MDSKEKEKSKKTRGIYRFFVPRSDDTLIALTWGKDGIVLVNPTPGVEDIKPESLDKKAKAAPLYFFDLLTSNKPTLRVFFESLKFDGLKDSITNYNPNKAIIGYFYRGRFYHVRPVIDDKNIQRLATIAKEKEVFYKDKEVKKFTGDFMSLIQTNKEFVTKLNIRWGNCKMMGKACEYSFPKEFFADISAYQYDIMENKRRFVQDSDLENAIRFRETTINRTLQSYKGVRELYRFLQANQGFGVINTSDYFTPPYCPHIGPKEIKITEAERDEQLPLSFFFNPEREATILTPSNNDSLIKTAEPEMPKNNRQKKMVSPHCSFKDMLID